MKHTSLTLSIIIPVYNEQAHLMACLEAIAKQTVAPDEVIVVDNNSTDDSIKIAKQFAFVKIINEPKQGYIPARNRGFGVAKGDILGRINGDSILSPNWVETLKADFKDPAVMGVTGVGKSNVILGFNKFYSTFWPRVFLSIYRAYFHTVIMWGANMAIRQEAWAAIKSKACEDYRLVHEDQDLSLLIAGIGGTILQDNKLLIQASGREYLYWPKLRIYIARVINTKRYHKRLNTYNHNFRRLSPLATLPVALLDAVFIFMFIIYSLVMWPIFWIYKKLTGRELKE